VGVLSVNVDQHFADLAQLRERRRSAVDEGTRAAVRIHHTPQHDGLVVRTGAVCTVRTIRAARRA
jgi:hypothetical protein